MVLSLWICSQDIKIFVYEPIIFFGYVVLYSIYEKFACTFGSRTDHIHISIASKSQVHALYITVYVIFAFGYIRFDAFTAKTDTKYVNVGSGLFYIYSAHTSDGAHKFGLFAIGAPFLITESIPAIKQLPIYLSIYLDYYTYVADRYDRYRHCYR